MEQYVENYINRLEEIAIGTLSEDCLLEQCLNWHYAQARKYLKNDFLKETGAFFTNEETSLKIASSIGPYISNKSIILDPSCGAGDLLLACAKYLPVKKTLIATVKYWGDRIAGYDINESFIRAAKARLIILARELTGDKSFLNINLDTLFPKIEIANGLEIDLAGYSNLILVMNPPFNKIMSSANIKWANGIITAASAFMYKYISECQNGTRFIAILPEVLRSGSRYSKWREFVAYNSLKLNKTMLGRFSACANVDVFILEGEVQHNCIDSEFMWWDNYKMIPEKVKIGDLFHVNIGSVVPHRDPEYGELYPYIYIHV